MSHAPEPSTYEAKKLYASLIGGVFISAATQTHRKNCAVNDSDGREVWRSRPTEAHVNKELCMAWDLTVESSGRDHQRRFRIKVDGDYVYLAAVI